MSTFLNVTLSRGVHGDGWRLFAAWLVPSAFSFYLLNSGSAHKR